MSRAGLLLLLAPVFMGASLASAATTCRTTPLICPPGTVSYFDLKQKECVNGTYTCALSSPNVSPAPKPATTPKLLPTTKPVVDAKTSSTLSLGSRGAAVQSIQQKLVSLGYLASDNATGYFGAMTKSAVQKFQRDRGIASSGAESTTGYGAAGPKTQAALTNASVEGAPVPSVLRVTPSDQSSTDIQQLLAQVQVLKSKLSSFSDTAPPFVDSNKRVEHTNQVCTLNGQVVADGASITAYEKSTVSSGGQCAFQTRTCSNGTLSGSYAYSACTVGGSASCTLDSVPVAHSASATFYASKTVPFGSSCSSIAQDRTCYNGTLSGNARYQYGTCSVTSASSCSFNNQSFANGATVTAYQSASVPFGSSCTPQTRTCTNGTLSGSYTSASCIVGAAQSCTFNGQSVTHGQSTTAYLSSSVAFGSSCLSQTRTCTNGTLSGTYIFGTCSANAPQSCTFNGQSVAHGANVTAYQSASVPFGSSCTPQTRTCTNGTLSGSYTNTSCVAGTPASCTLNGQTIAHGATVTAYQSASVPFGSSCTPQTRTCTDGTLSGSYTNASCVAATPASCTFNGQSVAHGASVTAYQSSSVAAGSQCVSENRTCANGALSGSYTTASCTVADPVLTRVPIERIHSVSLYTYADPDLTKFEDQLKKAKSLGFNTVWMVIAWVAIEQDVGSSGDGDIGGPGYTGTYDPAYVAQVKQRLQLLKKYDLNLMWSVDYLGEGWAPRGVNATEFGTGPSLGYLLRYSRFVANLIKDAGMAESTLLLVHDEGFLGPYDSLRAKPEYQSSYRNYLFGKNPSLNYWNTRWGTSYTNWGEVQTMSFNHAWWNDPQLQDTVQFINWQAKYSFARWFPVYVRAVIPNVRIGYHFTNFGAINTSNPNWDTDFESPLPEEKLYDFVSFVGYDTPPGSRPWPTDLAHTIASARKVAKGLPILFGEIGSDPCGDQLVECPLVNGLMVPTAKFLNDQKTYFQVAIPQFLSAGVGFSVWNLQDFPTADGAGTMGLLNESGAKKPAGEMVQSLLRP